MSMHLKPPWLWQQLPDSDVDHVNLLLIYLIHLVKLRQSMIGYSSEAKCRAYKAIVRPIMEYACAVWSPYTAKDVNLLEAVQKWALRWACGSHWDPSALS